MGLEVTQPYQTGGSNLFQFPNRVDLSVNTAWVMDPYSPNPMLHTGTGGNAVNGFNGAGVGNKSILGFDVGNGLPLGALANIDWNYQDLSPYIVQPWPKPFANLIIDLLGTNLLYVLAIIDPQANPALIMGTNTVNMDGTSTWAWNGATDAMLIVGSDVVSPAKPILLPPTHTVGVGFLNNSFSIATILATYPAATLRRASSLDGGMPRATVTPAFMLVEGDSANNRNINVRLGPVHFNGVAV